MISKANVDLILSLVKKFLPSVLEEVGFDPTVKEPGHTYGERVEEKLVENIIDTQDEPSDEEGNIEDMINETIKPSSVTDDSFEFDKSLTMTKQHQLPLGKLKVANSTITVSYTHLTLPTNREV